MKNFLFILSFVIIIPFSVGDTENMGCHSSKDEKTEHKKKDDNKNSESKDKPEDNCSAFGNNSRFFCYPYSEIE